MCNLNRIVRFYKRKLLLPYFVVGKKDVQKVHSHTQLDDLERVADLKQKVYKWAKEDVIWMFYAVTNDLCNDKIYCKQLKWKWPGLTATLEYLIAHCIAIFRRITASRIAYNDTIGD